MGQTALALSQVMEAERERIRSFRRALSKEDQEAFDRLFNRAKFHIHAGVYQARAWPMETILISILLEQGKLIEKMKRILEKKGSQKKPNKTNRENQMLEKHVEKERRGRLF